MTERIYLFPLWRRLWHWANAALILVLIPTGVSLHFSDAQIPSLAFATAARIHDIAGIALAALYVVFVLTNAITGNWWQYIPKPPGIFPRCLQMMRFYGFGILRGDPHPHEPTHEENFNALQAVNYFTIMYLVMPVIVVTGLIFMFPQTAPDRFFGLDGLLPVAVLHYLAGAAIALFTLVHIYLGSLGHTVTSQYKTMITGWHEVAHAPTESGPPYQEGKP